MEINFFPFSTLIGSFFFSTKFQDAVKRTGFLFRHRTEHDLFGAVPLVGQRHLQLAAAVLLLLEPHVERLEDADVDAAVLVQRLRAAVMILVDPVQRRRSRYLVRHRK